MASGSGALGLSQGEILISPGRRDPVRRILETAMSARDLINPAVNRPQEHWLSRSEERLDDLVSLRENWDGYGGVPVSEETRTTVLKLLYNVMSPRDVTPSLIPGSDGTVNVEWQRPGLVFEIEIEPDGHLSAYYHDEERETEWECAYREIEPRVGEFISRFADPT